MKAYRDSMMVMGANAPALGGEERSDEAPRAGAPPVRRGPDPEVITKLTRRRFTAEYRLRIVEEADRCAEPGEVGRLLRRERLYSSHLSAWRKARRRGALQGLARRASAAPSQRSPTPPAPRFAGSKQKWRAWRRNSPPRARFSRSREKLPGCWD